MKILKYSISFFSFLLGALSQLVAQNKVSELTVVYDYSVTSGNSTNPVSAFEGTTNTIYLKGNLVRVDMASPSFSSATIYDSRKGSGAILKELSGQKLLINLSSKNWEDINKKDEDIVFKKMPDTKNIAGYKCNKVIGTTKAGSEIIAYYTTEIVPDNKDYNPKFRSLDGLPLEYELTNGNFKINYKVSKINLNPVPASKFDIPKSGYREMTYEESKNLKAQ